MIRTIVIAVVALCAIVPWGINQLSLAQLHGERVRLERIAEGQGSYAVYILEAEGGKSQ